MDYLNRDYESILEDLKKKAKSLTNRWTDFSDNDLGVVYLQLLSGCLDYLNYYLDNRHNECYLPTAQELPNVIDLVSLIAFKYPFKQSSKCSISLLYRPKRDDMPDKVVLPRNTMFSTMNNIIYHLDGDVVLEANVLTHSSATQGNMFKIDISPSDITYSYKYALEVKNILEKTELYIDGELWEQVSDAFYEYEGGKKYSMHLDKDQNPYILFTHNKNEFITENSKIELVCFTTLGQEGAISVGNLIKLVSEITCEDSFGDIIPVEDILVSNDEPSSGGQDYLDANEVKARARLNLFTNDRLITLPDYDLFIKSFPGIHTGIALDWSVEGGYVSKPYLIHMYAVPKDAYELSDALAKSIEEEALTKSCIYAEPRVFSPEYIDVDIKVQVSLDTSVLLENSIITDCKSAIEQMYDKNNLAIGQSLWLSDIKSACFNVSSYINKPDGVTILSPQDNIVLRKNQFLRVNSVIVESLK